ncbi:MAG: hypothetical protein IPK22_07550 [Verrucomicrobiaceae bacterium]|nr:hypothetical protein [Verrucomicrobiaceae bacterium]
MRLSLLLLCLASSCVCAREGSSFASFMELPWRYVIGGHADGRWLNSEAAGRRLPAKTSYRLFTLAGEIGRASAGKAAPEADVCPDVWMQKLTPAPDLKHRAIGVNASWDPMPRKPEKLKTDDAALVQAVARLLATKGITQSKVQIQQAYRVDLPSAGAPIEIITATRYANAAELMETQPGDYSFVAIRAAGETSLRLVAGEFYPAKDPEAAPSIYDLAGLLDLNGDGTLEVLVHTAYYEGGGTQIWQWHDGRLEQVLAFDCGV